MNAYQQPWDRRSCCLVVATVGAPTRPAGCEGAGDDVGPADGEDLHPLARHRHGGFQGDRQAFRPCHGDRDARPAGRAQDATFRL